LIKKAWRSLSRLIFRVSNLILPIARQEPIAPALAVAATDLEGIETASQIETKEEITDKIYFNSKKPICSAFLLCFFKMQPFLKNGVVFK